MIEAHYLLFATGAVVSEEKVANYFGVTNMYHVAKLPTKIPKLLVIPQIVTTGKAIVNQRMRVQLSAVIDDREAFATDDTVENVTIERIGHWTPFIPIDGALFPTFGDYRMKLYVNGKLLIERPFYIRDMSDLVEP